MRLMFYQNLVRGILFFSKNNLWIWEFFNFLKITSTFFLLIYIIFDQFDWSGPVTTGFVCKVVIMTDYLESLDYRPAVSIKSKMKWGPINWTKVWNPIISGKRSLLLLDSES